MKTNLTLATVAAAPAKRRPAPSVSQNNQRSTIQMLGQIWRSMSFDERSTWIAASQAVSSASASTAGTPAKTNPYLTFIQMGGALYATQGSVPRTATAPVAFPAQLNNITLTATGSGSTLALTLNIPSDYPDKVIIRAAPPVPIGHSHFAKKSFRVAGSLPNLSTHTPITNLFAKLYHAPNSTATYAVEVTGVSASGLRTATIVLIANSLTSTAKPLTLE